MISPLDEENFGVAGTVGPGDLAEGETRRQLPRPDLEPVRQAACVRSDLVLVNHAYLAVRRLRVLVVEIERARDPGEHGKRREGQDQHGSEAARHVCKPPVNGRLDPNERAG